MSGLCKDCAATAVTGGAFCSTCFPLTGTHWRAAADRGTGWWHGRWKKNRECALRQAQRWADTESSAAVWLECSDGTQIEIESTETVA